MLNIEQLKAAKVCQQLVGRGRLSVAYSGKARQKQGREIGPIQTHHFLGQIQQGSEILSSETKAEVQKRAEVLGSETKAEAQLCGLGHYGCGGKRLWLCKHREMGLPQSH